MLLRYVTHTPIQIFTSSISSNADQPDTPVIAGITSGVTEMVGHLGPVAGTGRNGFSDRPTLTL